MDEVKALNARYLNYGTLCGEIIKREKVIARLRELGGNTENAAVKITELTEQIIDLRKKRDALLDEMLTDFLLASPSAYDALELRYIRCLEWKEVAQGIGHKHTSSAMKLCRKALERIVECKDAECCTNVI